MIEQAQIEDASAIVDLIHHHAQSGEMINRSLEEVRQHIAQFFVYRVDGTVLATCALTVFDAMVEVRSLAVHPEHYRKGIGTQLVTACIEQASRTEFQHIFVLTYATQLFRKLGFEVIDKANLPQKIWQDCQGCHKQESCDETAMIRPLAVGKNADTMNSQEFASVAPA